MTASVTDTPEKGGRRDGPLATSAVATVLWGDVAVVLALIGGAVTLHLLVPGLVPSGPDGGNWLAMAQDRFLGLEVMSAEVIYPPVFPALLALMLLGLDSLTALVVAALVAKCSVVLATYLVARPLGRGYAAGSAVLAGVAGAQLEAYSWGAYPQLLGTGLGTLALLFAVRHLRTGRLSHLVLALSLTYLTYLTHTMVGGLLVFAIPVAIGHQLWMKEAKAGDWLRGWWMTAAMAGPGALLALYNTIVNPFPGSEPVLNPLTQGRLDSLLRTVSEAPVPWVAVTALAVGALASRRWGVGSDPIAVSSSWVVAGAGFFTAIGEPRALLLTELGLLVLASAGFRRLLGAARARSQATRFPRLVPRVLVVVAVATGSGILAGGVDSYINSTSWYRVVDRAELDALDLLRDRSDPADLVLAAQGHHGNQVGWWVEGYARRRTFTGVDLAFLTFPEEREQARLAIRLFGGEMSDEEALRAMDAIGADYLVVDRRGPDAQWLESSLAAMMRKLHDSPTLVIFEVPG